MLRIFFLYNYLEYRNLKALAGASQRILFFLKFMLLWKVDENGIGKK